jgi:acyl-CoA synthetase (AMP-forming)/AMP-acid ligase II
MIPPSGVFYAYDYRRTRPRSSRARRDPHPQARHLAAEESGHQQGTRLHARRAQPLRPARSPARDGEVDQAAGSVKCPRQRARSSSEAATCSRATTATTRPRAPRSRKTNTGDIGRFDEAGYLAITDRKKDIIITAGGKNIAPQLIEEQLKFSPFVSQAVVIGDARPFVSALLTHDNEVVSRWAAERGISKPVAELVRDERLLAEVRKPWTR